MSEHYFSRKEALVSGENLKPINRAEVAMSKASGPAKLYINSDTYQVIFDDYMSAIGQAAQDSMLDNIQVHSYYSNHSYSKNPEAEDYTPFTDEDYNLFVSSLKEMVERGYGSAYVGNVPYPLMFVDPTNENTNGNFAFVSTYIQSGVFFYITTVVYLTNSDDSTYINCDFQVTSSQSGELSE